MQSLKTISILVWALFRQEEKTTENISNNDTVFVSVALPLPIKIEPALILFV